MQYNPVNKPVDNSANAFCFMDIVAREAGEYAADHQKSSIEDDIKRSECSL